MKNNKGFTLIEIIVCIALISIIGVSSTIIVIKTKNKNNNVNILNGTKMSTKLSNITNKILQAANVYIAVEKDGNGNTYETGIKNGGKGLYIKVQTLVDNGYLDKSVLNNLTKETNKSIDKLQLLAVDAVNKKDDKLCNNNNAIEYTVSWSNNNDKPIYLCPYDNEKGNGNIEKKLTLEEMMNNAKFSNNIGKSAVSQEWCNSHPNVDKTNIVCDENGLYIDRDKTKGITYYYYRGAVNNNYIKINDTLWRILWINSNKEAKLILENSLNIYVSNLKNNSVKIDENDMITKMHIREIRNRPTDDRDDDYGDNYLSKGYFILHKNVPTFNLNSRYLNSINLNSILQDCSTSGVDCTGSNGISYPRNYLPKIYQNLDKYYYLNNNDYQITTLTTQTLNNFYNAQIKNNNNFINYTYNRYSMKCYSETSKFYRSYHRNSNCLTFDSINNSPSSFEISDEDYYSGEYSYNNKIGFINYHELKMAGITETIISNSDNYLIQNNKNNYQIAEGYGDSKERYWYYVDGDEGRISNFETTNKTSGNNLPIILLRTYDQNKTLDSCSKWGGPRYYLGCTEETEGVDGSLLLGAHARDFVEMYSYKANTIRPVTVIKLNNYKLSDSSGTKEDPYTLTN